VRRPTTAATGFMIAGRVWALHAPCSSQRKEAHASHRSDRTFVAVGIIQDRLTDPRSGGLKSALRALRAPPRPIGVGIYPAGTAGFATAPGRFMENTETEFAAQQRPALIRSESPRKNTSTPTPVLPSLAGLLPLPTRIPPMNRWAMVGCPSGTFPGRLERRASDRCGPLPWNQAGDSDQPGLGMRRHFRSQLAPASWGV
jgi:hypothetical protein